MPIIARLFAGIARALDTYFSASADVWAVQEGREPERQHLRRLGIERGCPLSASPR